MGKLSNFFDLFKRSSSLEKNNINDNSILNEHENVEFNLKDNDYNINQIDNNENINASKERSINNYTLNNTFSNESDFLKLFKYDSIADSSKTFNIETALNNNWDKIDTFATNVNQQMEQKADKESPQFSGTPTINGNEIATINNIPNGLSLGETSSTAYCGDRGKVAYDHSQSAHAPSIAQKNSDITKAEIEAKLTGEVSTHTHASDSTKAPNNHASTTTAYGLGTTANYGHVKTINTLTQANHVDGTALSAYQGKVLNDKIDNVPTNIKGTLLRSGTLPTNFNNGDSTITIIPPFTESYNTITVEIEGTYVNRLSSVWSKRAVTFNLIFGDSSYTAWCISSAELNNTGYYSMIGKIKFVHTFTRTCSRYVSNTYDSTSINTYEGYSSTITQTSGLLSINNNYGLILSYDLVEGAGYTENVQCTYKIYVN